MKVAVFSTKNYDRQFLTAANKSTGFALSFFDPRLTDQTVSMADGFPAVCVFVNDRLPADVLQALAAGGTKWIALRCAGFNNVDLETAARLGMKVVRVPAYSPYAVAEHTVGLILALTRHIPRAYNRTRDANFALDGLLGFDLHGKTVGVVGTGKIGQIFAGIMKGFGCELLGFDPYPNDTCLNLGMRYVELDELLARSDIISLHCPLSPATHHLIDDKAVEQMKPGVTLINTSRGGVIDTQAVLAGLKSEKIGAVGLDVYEEEGDCFFEDLSNHVMKDDVLSRLMTFPNVLITGHQAFFTREALTNIAETTLGNLKSLAETGSSPNEVTSTKVGKS